MAVTLFAPSKVNWHLAVGSRLENGYHGISSIFQTCNLCDRLVVSVCPGPFGVSIHGLESLCPPGKSTLEKAALLWHQATGFDLFVDINITKNIPSQAGMGGGSSDAASLLLYLNSLSDCPMTVQALSTLGSRVGCDVPFFIYSGFSDYESFDSGCTCFGSEYESRAAYVSGLGENVVLLDEVKTLHGFVVVPSTDKVSTREAYEKLDSRSVVPALESGSYLVSMYNGEVGQWAFRNDFALVNSRPAIEVLPGESLFLTGSGSCWVLISERLSLEPTLGYSFIPVVF